jgi:hypothetical protein
MTAKAKAKAKAKARQGKAKARQRQIPHSTSYREASSGMTTRMATAMARQCADDLVLSQKFLAILVVRKDRRVGAG